MVTRRQLHGAAAQAASPIVFVDPSGRRWRKVRLIGAVIAAFFVVGILAAVPHLNDIPALSMTGERLGPPLTSDTTGKRVPVVGQGPLVQVLEVHRENGQTTGLDPSTKRRLRPPNRSISNRART
jgi:peptidoglycan-N-acetylglucosamine deacetylase